ncbi:MAG: ketose-bisphosphate aldolase [Gammaproteobacteria bacterium]|nr:ketose-bisphosphate aldolase [Gammaproteobacteria bacterium]MCW8840999.1 ketose-bisphosphate aldolase [Gammaproteobacteria bacterium]MCW8957550.1 ketose-bisphosphate aldolase [Gammaproteobacteria bacterium]MCW8972813.1 ketose-bisphosphate aldolase [Gammaproteobacteria bacterium]MCW8992114.1 ketose-bisphosphate aldolase [Gammaproteobacteria bacterium]
MMPLVNMQDMLTHAYDNAYAVGSFNILSLDFLEGVLRAAERVRAPVILGLSEPHFDHYDIAALLPAVESAAKRAEVPVAIHFDHGSSIEPVQRAIALGCNGVMIDASHAPLEENLKTTRQVVEMAHACGVPVEAELGYVPEADEGGADLLSFTTVDQARGFIKHTGADFLAVSIGTVHGHLKGKPRLDYQRLRHINDALGIPLVIHGGSGLSDDQYHRLITGGVAKINYHTALSERAAKTIRSHGKSVQDYAGLMEGVREAIATEAEQCMRNWGSAGRAAEVISRCRGWSTAVQLTQFNVEMAAVDDMQMVLARGRRLLGAIPGVREVSTGHTTADGARHRFFWQVTLNHVDAAEAYLRHPNYRDFSHRLLAGISSDKQALLYQSLGSLPSEGATSAEAANWG